MSAGALPGFGAGAVVHGAVLFSRWRLEIGASVWPARVTNLAGLPDVGGRFTLVAADLRACPDISYRVVELAACVGIEGGVMRGVGFGVTDPHTALRPWLAAVPALGLRFRVHARVRLGLEAQVPVAILRPRFHLQDLGRVHESASTDLRGIAGIEVRL